MAGEATPHRCGWLSFDAGVSAAERPTLSLGGCGGGGVCGVGKPSMQRCQPEVCRRCHREPSGGRHRVGPGGIVKGGVLRA
eukprot:358696-Chlamydomonas_euryale.AAC.2